MNTEELKRLAQAATPGPWEYQKDSKDFPINGYVTVRDCIYSVCVLPYEGIRTDDRVTDNGAYIAAANPAAILALIQQRDELLAAHAEMAKQKPVAWRHENGNIFLPWQKDLITTNAVFSPLYAAPVPAPHPGATHCDDCGLTWLDDGLNPLGCPYCKNHASERNARRYLALRKVGVQVPGYDFVKFDWSLDAAADRLLETAP